MGAASFVAGVLWYMPAASRSPCDRTCVSGRVRGRASSACSHGSDRGPRMSPSVRDARVPSCGGSLALVALRGVSHRGELGEVTESFADKHAAIKLKVPASMQRAKHQDAHTNVRTRGMVVGC